MLVEIIGKRNEEKLITTSLKVAEKFEKRHQEILYAIEGRKCSCDGKGCEKCQGRGYQQLGLLQENLEISVKSHLSEMFEKESYTDAGGRKRPLYKMNRDGFTLLVMGFTGEKALKWKIDYINAFNSMEKILKSRIQVERQQWQIERDKGVVIRHILTDTIKMKIADSPHKRFAYPNYTNLIYRTLFHKTAKELEEEYGVKSRENLRDYFTGNELEQVQSMEMLVSSLIGCGWGYAEIKTFVQNNANKMIEN